MTKSQFRLKICDLIPHWLLLQMVVVLDYLFDRRLRVILGHSLSRFESVPIRARLFRNLHDLPIYDFVIITLISTI